MNSELWRCNHPSNFWQLEPEPLPEAWQEAIQRSIPVLGLDPCPEDIEHALALTLGEGQFGPRHWQLSPIRRTYYQVKPLLPHSISSALKQLNRRSALRKFPLHWPVEPRYAHFMWDIIQQLLFVLDLDRLSFRRFWPDEARFALVLTHDIESAQGQANAGKIADLEESLGFRSSFNFVPELYSLDHALMHTLRERGFEIGLHGLKHDGKLFRSKAIFLERAERINRYLDKFDARGFRAPLMHRNPEWMQALDIEYDLSFFDSDPYEPMPGGCMSIWPFTIGHFLELPYTLVQDCTLATVLGETSPRLWLEKLEFIDKYHGMALLTTHPDYLIEPHIYDIYRDFLHEVKARADFWNALPSEVAHWWRRRTTASLDHDKPQISLGTIVLKDGEIAIH